MSTYTFSRDLLGNEQADIRLPGDTRYQIVQIDSTVYFSVRVDGSWSPISEFRYAEAWRAQTRTYGPWDASTFRAMIKQFVADCEEQ